jgi:hypothetical protein
MTFAALAKRSLPLVPCAHVRQRAWPPVVMHALWSLAPPSAQLVARVAALIAALGCVALVVETRLRLRAWQRTGLAAALALAGVFTYYEFLSIPAPAFFHRWEMFHYVLGAKYSPELGYERLYRCVAVADADNGHRDEVSSRPLRDLHDDELTVGAAALRDPNLCTSHFSRERWRAFRGDVARFRGLVSDDATWANMQADHGYNPSPVWTLIGRPLASAAPISAGFLQRLAWLDPLLMAASLGAFAWGFGLRSAWLACVFWSTQAPSNFSWTGGGFLRQDWLFLAFAALALARKRKPFTAGACLAWSALLRVFPLIFFAGALVLLVARSRRRRPIPSELRRFFAGAAAAASVLLLLSAAAAGGVTSYRGFAEHLYMHSRSPISNHMSLRAVLSFAPELRLARQNVEDEAAMSAWSSARRARIAARWPLHALCAGLFVWALARCVWRVRTLWIALALSVPLVMVLTDPAAYYYSMLVLVAPLARARRSVEVMLLGLAAASQLLSLQVPFVDDRYVVLSALYLLFACALIALFSRPLRPHALS